MKKLPDNYTGIFNFDIVSYIRIVLKHLVGRKPPQIGNACPEGNLSHLFGPSHAVMLKLS